MNRYSGVRVFRCSGVPVFRIIQNPKSKIQNPIVRAVNDPSGRRAANRPADGEIILDSPPSLVRNERSGKGTRGGLGEPEHLNTRTPEYLNTPPLLPTAYCLLPRLLLACVLLGATLSRGQAQENWPGFGGPTADGHSQVTGLPLRWSETQNIRWKTPLPGKGWSSPVVWGRQIWLTNATEDGKQMFVVCVERESGKVLLNRKLFENPEPEPINDVNSYASPTPVIEAGRVYVHFGTYGTVCLSTTTFEILWQRRDLHCTHSVGPGSSPILYNNLLILTLDGIDVQYTVALNKQTGKTVWKTPRSVNLEPQGPEMRKAFVTPILATVGGKPQLLSTGAQATYAYDPQNGKELWRLRFNGYSGAHRPLFGQGLVFINTGYNRAELWAIRPNGTGDVTDSHIAWKYTRNVPNKPAPILVDDLIYMARDGGVLTCLEAKTGNEVWKERIGGNYSASPLFADGRIYFFSEDGKTTVLKPGRKLEVLAENRLSSGFMASPAVAGKALFLRTKTHLYRVEL